MFDKDEKKQEDIFSIDDGKDKEEKTADPITDISRRDVAMIYMGMALETRRNFSRNTKIMKFLLSKLKSAVVASVPEYTPEQLVEIQKKIRTKIIDGIFMKEIDKAIDKLTKGEDPMGED